MQLGLQRLLPRLKASPCFECRPFRASTVLCAPNHYQILGLKPSCSEKDIKLAYFKLAKKFHPDLNPEESARIQFERVQKAYEILADDLKRSSYDKQQGFHSGRGGPVGSFKDHHKRKANSTIFSDDEDDEEYYNIHKKKEWDKRTMPKHDWQRQRGSQQFWKGGPPHQNSQNGGQQGAKQQFKEQVFDEFDDYFDFKRQTEEAGVTRDDTRGADYQADVEVEFEQAVLGTRIELDMNKRVVCETCNGTRAKPASKPRKCYECSGTGSLIGNYGIKKRCLKCEGAGCIPKTFCPSCEGLGVQRSVLSEVIDLPRGMSDGQKLKVPYKGHAADVVTSMAGDLLIKVNVKRHDFYEREGKNIRSTVELTLSEAILGCQITIATVHGPLNIEVSPGQCSGDEMVLRNFGAPDFNPGEEYDEEALKGDHIVTFKVILPHYDPNSDEEIHKILTQMIENENQNQERYYSYYAEQRKKKQQDIDDEWERSKEARRVKREKQAQDKTQQGQKPQPAATPTATEWFKSFFA